MWSKVIFYVFERYCILHADVEPDMKNVKALLIKINKIYIIMTTT